MLRIAVPNKGSLSEAASAMLREAGYNQRREAKELILDDPDNSAQFVFLRPRDIALYVGSGTLDAGITGRDLLLDSRAPADEVLPLGFARSTFRFAGRPGWRRGSATSRAAASRRATRACWPSTSPSTASPPTSSTSTARSRPRWRSASPT